MSEAATAEVTAPEAPSGIEAFMSDIVAAANTPETPEPAKDAPKPEVKPAPKPEVKVETKPEVKPPAKTTPKPEAKPEPTKPEGAHDLRKRLEQLSATDKERLKEIEALKSQNKDLSGRRVLTPEVEKEIEQNKQEIAALRRQITESAYERSDEFKTQFVKPYEQTLQAAIASVGDYLVATDDQGGTRAATKADFLKVAGAHPSERAQIARQIFGDNALNVLSDIRELEGIRRRANEAVKNHQDGFAAREKEAREQEASELKAYQTHRENARKDLYEKFPEFFGEVADDPEMNQAWNAGREFVEKAAEAVGRMNPEERAAYAEVVTARAMAFPRMHRMVARLQAKTSELEAELAKYRSGEPEPKADGQPSKKGDEGPKGIEDLTTAFDNMQAE